MSKIGDVCRLAADEYLWDGCGDGYGQEILSCCAVGLMGHSESVKDWVTFRGIFILMRSMGLDAGRTQFQEFAHGVERQSVRHAWLYFVAMIADEGALE